MRYDHHIAAVIWILTIFTSAVYAKQPFFLLLLFPLATIYFCHYIR